MILKHSINEKVDVHFPIINRHINKELFFFLLNKESCAIYDDIDVITIFVHARHTHTLTII